MVRDIIPFIFWPWLFASCGILLHRRIATGSWRPGRGDTPTPQGFALPSATLAPRASPARPADLADARASPGSPAHPRALAQALGGIAMPCDLAPLVGSGEPDPRRVAFFTRDRDPATIGTALSDELERLGYSLTPENDRSIRGQRGDDAIRARLVSAVLDSDAVMRERHPSAPAGAIVVELELV